MKTRCHLLTAAFAAFTLSSCDKPGTSTSSPEIPPSVLDRYFTAEPLPDAMAIHIARNIAKPGDEITLKGEVMGRENVFVGGRASFILGDPEILTTCDKMPDDKCVTPWDACCDSKELKRVGLASVQILGEDGRVLSEDIRGANGMKELSSVTLTGTVAEGSTAENLIVNATRIHVSEP